LTAWDTFGTPVVTGGVDDPEGGTGAFTVEDNDGAGSEHIFDVVSFTGDGTKSAVWVVRENVAPSVGSLRLSVWDNTAFANRLAFLVDWDGGEPDVADVVGSFLGARRLGNGWWAIYGQTTSVTAANDHQIHLWPSSDTSGTSVVDVWRANAFDSALPPSSILDASQVLGAETFYAPYLHAPSVFATEGGTLYAKWIERGTRALAIAEAVSKRYVALGESDGSPRVLLYVSSSGFLRALHGNGTNSSDQAIGGGTFPVFGDVVEMICQVYPDGSVQPHVSINGAAVVSGAQGGTPIPFASAWNSPNLALNSTVDGTAKGLASFLAVKVVRGVHTMAEMRKIATARLYQRVA
jgi:hypothetical protein